VKFTTQANFETSGGFGPNQVASALAFGALLLLLDVLLSSHPFARRLLLLAVAGVFMVQSTMTFSRGGLISMALSILVVSPLLLVTKRQRVTAIWVGVALLFAMPAAYLALNEYTGGKLEARFSKTSMSGREALMQSELKLWEDNPAFGIGVGLSRFYQGKASHTEFTRALAENGVLGLLAYLALVFACLRRTAFLLRDRTAVYLPLLLAVMTWAFLYMIVNANRTSAPALALGLAFVTVHAVREPGLGHDKYRI
jgi:O-antigen ligase